MKKPAQPLPATSRVCADILVAASSPKLPPLQGDESAPRATIPAWALSSPKLPPFQGD
jgi:hypothetical protein